MDELEFRVCLKIDVTVLDVWVEQGWVVPRSSEKGRQFRDADVARGRLILDLIDTMGVNEAGVDVAMDLLDQVHSLRGTLRELVEALNAEDEAVRRRIVAKIETIAE
ncbi:transcriptional regulator [Neorhizobium sp. P12A]|uniref:chaperone modulator CbpM n=1 Tax=Neorhizobium sp. P12A TaxID=2268027 RepID=UPI0011EDCB19|nr:chaperone modulator CbpM [Neorhizobium sp. P12A]KAA0699907.1 transcriptional regulator [Neorhizobium sp. P12A]